MDFEQKFSLCLICRSPAMDGNSVFQVKLQSCENVSQFLCKNEIFRRETIETSASGMCDRCLALVLTGDRLMLCVQRNLKQFKDLIMGNVEHKPPEVKVKVSEEYVVPTKVRRLDDDLSLENDFPPAVDDFCGDDDDDDDDYKPNKPATARNSTSKMPSKLLNRKPSESNQKQPVRKKPDWQEWSRADPTCGEGKRYTVENKKQTTVYTVDGFPFQYPRIGKDDHDLLHVRCLFRRVTGVECPVGGVINLREKLFYYHQIYSAVNHCHVEKEVPANAVFMTSASESVRRSLPDRNAQKDFMRCHLPTGKKGYKCELCDYKIRQFKSLVLHTTSVHLVPNGFKCFECGLSYAAHPDYSHHMELHRLDNCDKVSCITCRTTMTKDALHEHVKLKHCGKIGRTKDERLALGIKARQCLRCSFVGMTETAFGIHAALEHREEQVIKCDECDKEFKTQRTLRDHENSVHGKKTYECAECGLVNSSRTAYERHLETHKPMKGMKLCPQCGKALRAGSLLGHMIVFHNHPMRKKCNYCGLIVPSDWELSKHKESVHGIKKTKIKRSPRLCVDCGKTFRNVEEFVSHRIKMHGDQAPEGRKPHTCVVCGDIFPTRDLGRKHEKNIHGLDYVEQAERGIECELCGVTAKEKYEFRDHLHTSHGIKVPIKQIRDYVKLPEPRVGNVRQIKEETLMDWQI